ncbi:MAG: folylpolyglutamate synthase/dihydrofolate synthase family protein [Prevotella sp.]|nr:folylpolyglutamate synthase/dihydrofolate synthase family protein [Prevotella sp.]
MNYQQTVAYLFNATPVFEHVGASAYKEGLENTLALDRHFGHPHEAYKTIHIAGTNGKGSCSHTIAAILQAAGYKVGLYTSPHLVDFRERIRVNGEPISEQRVVDFVEQERAFFEPLHPSFFELTTALAFLYFKEQKVDVAVVEVGLGGRLDCTNIIRPELSIITNISFDHTQFLGNTLAKIAGEKAGIIKPHTPVVIGEDLPETRPVFEAKAKAEQAPVTFALDKPEVTSSTPRTTGGRDYDTRHYGHLYGELGGDYQVRNTNTVLHALNLLKTKFHITDDNIAYGMAHVVELTGLRGRWEQVRQQPRVVCDTGHNVGGWQYLGKQIAAQPCRQLRIVFGMVDDKDIHTVMQLLPRKAVYYWVQATSKRAFPSAKVAEEGKKAGLNGADYGSVANGYQHALADAASDDFIFVGGSSYIVADFLALNHF